MTPATGSLPKEADFHVFHYLVRLPCSLDFSWVLPTERTSRGLGEGKRKDKVLSPSLLLVLSLPCNGYILLHHNLTRWSLFRGPYSHVTLLTQFLPLLPLGNQSFVGLLNTIHILVNSSFVKTFVFAILLARILTDGLGQISSTGAKFC